MIDPMYPFTKSSLPVALIGVCLLSTGCASQKQLQEYQNEVRSLRGEDASPVVDDIRGELVALSAMDRGGKQRGPEYRRYQQDKT